MKTLIFIICIGCLISFDLCSQNTQIDKIQNLKSNILVTEADYLDVRIESWKNDYVQIESTVKINNFSGEEHHDLKIDHTNQGLKIVSSIDTEDIEKMVIVTDKEGNKTYTPLSEWNEKMEEKGFNSMNIGYEIDGHLTIYLPAKMNAEVNTVYGDINIDGAYKTLHTHSTYGLVEAKLVEVSKMESINMKSVYDIVDLSLEKNSDASLNLQTSYGAIFSDLPLKSKLRKSKHQQNGCTSFSGQYVLNNGDVAIDIVATYDNIYVRSF